MAERLLVVEDELNVGSTLTERLGREGFDVTWTKSVAESLERLRAGPEFALALLDVGLPDGTGFDLAEGLRARHRGTAIIFLTAFGAPEDRIRGLELGAEDYIVKPFHLKELLLRITRSLVRARALSELSGADAGPVRIGQATVQFARFTAERDGRQLSLTHKECALLKLLVDRRGRVVSRDEILNHVWSENEFPSPRTVDNFIMRLRRIVELDPENPAVIKSVRGVGYLLDDGEATK